MNILSKYLKIDTYYSTLITQFCQTFTKKSILHKIYIGEKEHLAAISFLRNILDLGMATGPERTS